MSRAWLGIVVVLLATACGGAKETRMTERGKVSNRDVAHDAALARRVRQQIMSDSSVSPEARNLYISSSDGIVTVRGAVSSEAEHDKVRKLVQTTPGSARIEDAMTVLSPEMSAALNGVTKSVASEGAATQ